MFLTFIKGVTQISKQKHLFIHVIDNQCFFLTQTQKEWSYKFDMSDCVL